MDNRKRFNPKKLELFSSEVLQKIGVSKEDADITAKMLGHADLRGVESHGIAHLSPFYVNWIKEGKVNPKPELRWYSDSPTTAILDGGKGLGFVASYHAMLEAIKRAQENGSGFVSVKNSSHCGAAAYYAMMALEHNMIGISMTVGGRIMMAPGSKGRAGGLNPISIAVPTDKRHPFVLDMSTSVVAFGKIEIAKRQGKSIPEGWVVDENGNPITDTSKINPADSSFKGGILPLGGLPHTGGFKGFGLSVFVDILCTLISGAPLASTANHFFGAIDINGFRPVSEFKKQMDELIDSIENLEPLPGYNKVYAAGGFEYENEKERLAKGIPLDEEVINSLKELSKEFNIGFNAAM
jgi:LDH2 family malate/lactate/ureidoglycolate dehydrogenase